MRQYPVIYNQRDEQRSFHEAGKSRGLTEIKAAVRTSFKVDEQVVVPRVRKDLQVLRSVIELVPVDMMHDLMRFEIPAKFLLRHESMLKDIPRLHRMRVTRSLNVAVPILYKGSTPPIGVLTEWSIPRRIFGSLHLGDGLRFVLFTTPQLTQHRPNAWRGPLALLRTKQLFSYLRTVPTLADKWLATRLTDLCSFGRRNLYIKLRELYFLNSLWTKPLAPSWRRRTLFKPPFLVSLLQHPVMLA